MNKKQFERMSSGKGFIAALDQSGGSTPRALRAYGIMDDEYVSDIEMFNLVHEMRTRIITSPSFTSDRILGAILFENTMDRKIKGRYSADYLWDVKGIVPFLKVDKGLAPESHGVQVMKDIPNLEELLKKAVDKHIFGTKMRSVIKKADAEGIRDIVDQQFEIGKIIIGYGLVPIIEPEVDIFAPDKAECEKILKAEILRKLAALDDGDKVIFKLSIPSEDGFYSELMKDSHVVRVVALSGGYSRKDANEKLSRNPGLIASFSRALAEGLNVHQSDKEFDDMMADSIEGIYEASIK